MNISIGNAVSEGTESLRRAGVAEARRQASDLLAHAIGHDRTFVITHAEESLEPGALDTFRRLIRRRAAGEPLQYLTGHQEFFRLDFEVNAEVLIPRPETELLVEASLELLRERPKALIADIGTGSGCIAISLLHELPDVRAVGTDISAAALAVTRRNADRHGVSDRLTLIESDCFSVVPRGRQFSLVVSNPPYIREDEWPTLQREVRDYEPRRALVSGPDGLSTIGRLLSEAPAFLGRGGYLVFEIGFGQRESVEQLIDPDLWKSLAIREDLQHIPRAVVLRRD